jgi:hypothetical protein
MLAAARFAAAAKYPGFIKRRGCVPIWQMRAEAPARYLAAHGWRWRGDTTKCPNITNNGFTFLSQYVSQLRRVAMELRDDLEKLAESLKQQRDELQLKMHLLNLEAREEWEKAEQNWQHFQSKAEELGKAGAEASKDVGAAVKLLGEELRHAYERVRKSL